MCSALTLSIDVPRIDQGVRFFTEGLGCTIEAQPEATIYELSHSGVRIYLLEKAPGTRPHGGGERRNYERHWTPVHLDLEVEDLEAAVARAVRAGATVEHRGSDPKWGEIATLSDPFGNGFCLIRPASRES